MKSRFSTLDIGVIVKELKRFLGMRVVNVYDVDNKTYLIRIAKPDEKAVILLESGIRLHSTGFDWPKNPAPSGFSMKMRKHLKSRRFENIEQLGVDRIVDMQFGSGEAAYHVILELYDRGNIVLTDWEYSILNILRPRTDNSQDVRFAVREKYPVSSAKHHEIETEESMRQILLSAKSGDQLRRVLVSHLDYGPAVIEHCLLEAGFAESVQIGKGFDISTDFSRLMQAIQAAEAMMTTLLSKPCKGFIIQRVDKKPNPKEGEQAELATYDEFHPLLFAQLAKKSFLEFESLDKAVDEFFSKLESQKLDIKVLQQERSALKKLDNVKRDHEKRITELQKEQEVDITRGQLVEINLDLVDKAILVVRSALANQIDWTDIGQLVKEAQANDDPVAKAIVGLKLDSNHITMLLSDPFDAELADEEYTPLKPLKVDIDLGLSAYANSRKFFEKKKHAAKKEQKTMEASNKALKSAEKKTKETLKDMATVASINKTRKTYWFEKFLWFISSENYLVIGGRDQQQNELIVKRYLKPGDLYVHADLHGASSVVVKNPTGEPVPPKTLNEAGTMAICNSAAWDAKVVTSAWWVNPDQVSKTAPSGEYLTTGSFMIRGKKNYLPPSYLIYGFGFLFKLEDGSIARHIGERRVRVLDEDAMSESVASELESGLSLDDIKEEEEEKDSFGNSDSSESEGKPNKPYCNDSEGEGDGQHTEERMSGEELSDFEATDTAAQPEQSTSDRAMTTKLASASLVEFPDTSINLAYVKGDKFELQRLHSSASCTAEAEVRPSTSEEMSSNRPGGRLSAKQRREMRKAKKAVGLHRSEVEDERDDEPVVLKDVSDENTSTPSSAHILHEADECGGDMPHQEQQSQQVQQQSKRGQKGKLRKIKEKYKDQDEEERKLKMEILASSGPQKEDKKKKNKKGRGEPPAKAKQGSQQLSGKGQGQGPGSAKRTETTVAASGGIEGVGKDRGEMVKPAGFVKEEAPDVASDEEPEALEEDTQTQDDLQILNSLTGLPHQEDELLYAIPCCAPYNALTAYKYKVKLLPGTTKRGKAAKSALNMFQHDRSATPREKDLLRIMKDADLSRNMPGKVKVAAPNLHKR